MTEQNDLNNQMTQLDELVNKIYTFNDNKDFSNPDFKATFFELLKKCKPFFIDNLEDARGLKISIERKNDLLNDILMDGDYDLYDKKKEEYSDLNGSSLENNLSVLEHYFNVVDSCLIILRQNDSFVGHEYFMYSEKTKNLAFVINEVEQITYMR